MEKPKYHIFVCCSLRMTGEVKGVCAQKDGIDIARALAEGVQERDISDQVMVTPTGCFGLCTKGPVVMIYPHQIWYGKVTPEDVEDILDAIENESSVDRLLI